MSKEFDILSEPGWPQLSTHLGWLGGDSRLPVGLVGKDCPKVANNVHDPKDKAARGVEAGEVWFLVLFVKHLVT